MIKLGPYKICILDLVVDDKTGKLSGGKVWFNIANGIMSKIMLTADVTWELMATYGAIVGGSHAAILFLKWRYRDAANVSEYSAMGGGQPQTDYSGGGPASGVPDGPPRGGGVGQN